MTKPDASIPPELPSVKAATEEPAAGSHDNGGESHGHAEASKPAKQSDAAPIPRSRRARWFRRLAVLASGVFLLFLFSPQLATSGPGRAWIAHRLSKETHLSLAFGSIDASWWRPLVVKDVNVATPSGATIATVETIETSKSLWGLLRAGVDKGELHITRPAVRLDLGTDVLSELTTAIKETRPDKGMLGKIANPNKDSRLEIHVDRATASVRPQGIDVWEDIATECSPTLLIERSGGSKTLTISPGPICQLQVSPVLCDWGLEYVLPVLAGAVDADGQCRLTLYECRLDLNDPSQSVVSGELYVDAIRAEVQGPVLRAMTTAVVKLAKGGDAPVTIHLTENCPIDFAMTDGRVYHEGLRFGLPRLLPALAMQTRGSMGLDQTLDLYLETELPLNRLGDGPVLQRLGSPELSIPIAGTLADPKVDIGGGKVAASLVQQLVESVTDDSVDPGPLLEQIGELGLLEKWRERRQANAQQANAQQASDAVQDPDQDRTTPNDSADPSDDRPRLIDRIRERGGLFRRRNTGKN